MKPKFSPQKLFKPLIRLILVVLVFISVCLLLTGGYDPSLLFGIPVVLCVPILPTLYLFIEYYIVAKKQTIEVTPNSIDVAYSNGHKFKYDFKDLKSIELYKTKGIIFFTPASMYYHARILTKDGSKIVLPSVIEPSVEEILSVIKGIEIDITRTMYSTIYW